METLIKVWIFLGYSVYWIGWLGSVLLFDVGLGIGILIGLGCYIFWLIILQVLYLINGDGWMWQW